MAPSAQGECRVKPQGHSLPHLDEIFDRLRKGHHLCGDDGPIYLALRTYFVSYQELFRSLGFDLVQHDRGFAYFQSQADLGKEATALAVFFFVLVEYWGDAGRDIEEAAFDPVGHRVPDLPHFERDSWRQCMVDAGVAGQDDLEKVVQNMERYGFAERFGDDRFRFRPPAWRFLDLCSQVLEELEQTDDTPVNSPPEDEEESGS